MRSSGSGSPTSNRPSSSARVVKTDSVIGSCNAARISCHGLEPGVGAGSRSRARARSTRRIDNPQRRNMSVALLDHGEIVPTRGATQSVAAVASPAFASRMRCSLSASIACVSPAAITYTWRAERSWQPAATRSSSALRRSIRKADRAGWPSRTIMAVGVRDALNRGARRLRARAAHDSRSHDRARTTRSGKDSRPRLLRRPASPLRCARAVPATGQGSGNRRSCCHPRRKRLAYHPRRR